MMTWWVVNSLTSTLVNAAKSSSSESNVLVSCSVDVVRCMRRPPSGRIHVSLRSEPCLLFAFSDSFSFMCWRAFSSRSSRRLRSCSYWRGAYKLNYFARKLMRIKLTCVCVCVLISNNKLCLRWPSALQLTSHTKWVAQILCIIILLVNSYCSMTLRDADNKS